MLLATETVMVDLAVVEVPQEVMQPDLPGCLVMCLSPLARAL